MDAPKHAFEVTVRVGGEDWPLTLRELRRLTDHIEEHGPDCNMFSGGAGTASDVRIEKRDVSPEQYRKELEQWRQNRRKGGIRED